MCLKIESIGTLISASATAFAAVVAIYGINSWRREFIGKRDIEFAEEVLELFYRAQDAIRAIRSPLGNTAEGKKIIERLKAEGKDAEIGSQTAVLIERYEDRQEVFEKLQALRYRFIARFGKDKAKPFDDLKETMTTMFISAQMLFALLKSRKDGDIDAKNEESVKAQIRQYEADLMWADKEKDKITPMVESAVEQIEEVCRNIINSRQRLWSGLIK